jgi:hypothetical protein
MCSFVIFAIPIDAFGIMLGTAPVKLKFQLNLIEVVDGAASIILFGDLINLTLSANRRKDLFGAY